MSLQSELPRENQSDVARIRALISAGYEACQRGLYGLSLGTARHDFITANYANVGQHVEELGALIGKNNAMEAYFEIQDITDEKLQTEQGQIVLDELSKESTEGNIDESL